jgi:hypothetical protein
VLLEAASADALPPCQRFVPGGEYLSYVSRGNSPAVVLMARDGGSATLGAPDVDVSEGLGCLDWRLRPQ